MVEERTGQDDVTRRAAPGLERAAPLLVLAIVLTMVAWRASDLATPIEVARMSRAELASDDDLYRSEPILGPEYPILARLRRDHPAGTRVAVPLAGAGTALTRGQRFWLALLPEYPIAGDAELVICPLPCREPGLTLVERGEEFGLLRRGGPPAERSGE